MRKLTLTVLSTFTCGMFAFAGPETIQSSSKEMKQTVAPVPTCDFSWTGFYLGGHAGYGWGNAETRFTPLPDAASFFALEPTTLDPDPDGFAGGGQIGFNWQLGHFVLGVETDFNGSDIGGSTSRSPIIDTTGVPAAGGGPSVIRTREDINWYGTARGRIGFAPMCRLLVYGTGGLAYGNVDYEADTDFRGALFGIHHYPTSFNETNVGWTAGGGLEFAIARHWTIKAEYLYVDLGDQSTTAGPLPNDNPPFRVHYNWETQAHTVNAGLNFKF